MTVIDGVDVTLTAVTAILQLPLDGVGLHYYTDFITPAEVQVEAMKSFPSKFLLNTESCEGGPNWDKNFVDSPITVFPEHNEFHKQPMYYAMGHFSKFIPRGSKIIRRVQTKSMFTSFESVAVLTPESTVVVVMYNTGSARTVNVKLGNKVASIHCPGAAVITVELPYEP
ncbi:Glucosylceramidase [Operophtera brumata]|uniref:Glucosylceramidase n=1 Tax=Operophtera brumata TaxID=104452 RepID=A0A0L7KWG0_OPEBR|nr:Glucosylceramidase [Operophtera brumata]